MLLKIWCSSKNFKQTIILCNCCHILGKKTYDLHMSRQYCHLLEYMRSLVYLDHPGPSISPSRWCPFCLEKFLRVQVPLGCVKTAFVTEGLGSRKICQDNGREYTYTTNKARMQAYANGLSDPKFSTVGAWLGSTAEPSELFSVKRMRGSSWSKHAKSV